MQYKAIFWKCYRNLPFTDFSLQGRSSGMDESRTSDAIAGTYGPLLALLLPG